MDFFADLFAVFGRSHPLLLHMPIGMLVGLGFVELIAVKRGHQPMARLYVFIAACTAVFAAASGLVLHEEPGYESSSVLEWHEWLGIATAAFACVCFAMRLVGAIKFYRIFLLLSVVVMIPAGHFGAEMTHGKGFLWEPFETSDEPEYVPPVLPKIPGNEVDPESEDPSDPVDSTDLTNASDPENGDKPTAENDQPQIPEPILASYEEHIAPMFAARCNKCHGERKSKGDLRMDSADAILAGGENGEIIVFGMGIDHPEGAVVIEESEIYQRLLLPLDDDDHMPPESKTQLTNSEIEFLRLWLEAGAPFEEPFELGAGKQVPPPTVKDPPKPDKPKPNPEEATSAANQATAVTPAVAPTEAAPQEALLALTNALIHVQPVEPGSTMLWVDFAAPAATIDDAQAHALLQPLQGHIGELSLARTKITDASLSQIAAMPALTRLDLRNTAITNTGLAELQGHQVLQQLVLSQTQVTDEAAATLQSLPSLHRLWVWDAKMTADGLAALRNSLPHVHIDAGDLSNPEVLETEGDLVFNGDAPLVDGPADGEAAPAVADVASLTPINTVCPVSGKPVDPKYSVVYEGRVIGFCCPNCPKTFWENPEACLAKLPK
ncbi:MAG: hypothetical protein GY902_05040 [Planctomycetes bacterium]|nr:hypothetical protein [Planctomycetota bacterium]